MNVCVVLGFKLFKNDKGQPIEQKQKGSNRSGTQNQDSLWSPSTLLILFRKELKT